MSKEKPILFNADMVRAILDGRKTQTRRIVKNRGAAPDFRGGQGELDDPNAWGWECGESGQHIYMTPQASDFFCCPYIAGDELWVRETWQGFRQVNIEYDEWEAMESPKDRHNDIYQPVYKADNSNFPDKWFPSIYMPREFSRIQLRIMDIRVERLKNISTDDAKAEGVVYMRGLESTAIKAFELLWRHINGDGSWCKNPWVWVVEFERIDR